MFHLLPYTHHSNRLDHYKVILQHFSNCTYVRRNWEPCQMRSNLRNLTRPYSGKNSELFNSLRGLMPLNNTTQDTADRLSCKYLQFPPQLTETSQITIWSSLKGRFYSRSSHTLKHKTSESKRAFSPSFSSITLKCVTRPALAHLWGLLGKSDIY